MRKRKEFERVVFDVPLFEAFFDEFQSIVEKPENTKIRSLQVERGAEKWDYESVADFYADVRLGFEYSNFQLSNDDAWADISSYGRALNLVYSTVSVTADSRDRIQRLFHICESAAERCFIPKPEKPAVESTKKPKPLIFIGHGHSPQWRDVKDHLHDLHGYDVISYESGARAGHTVRDVIGELLEKASFGILVMTGEDRHEDGSLCARQNVIHEIGLFQGRLGFTKAIVLLEEGTQEFSNLYGVNQIRFSRERIREAFGDLLAVLRREFPEVGR